MTGRLILDASRPAPLNMALDETLLDRSPPHGTITLRRTAWVTPAATLGRFQRYTEFEIAGATRPSVRRITGGGAILHHEELTIAVVAPTPSPLFPVSKPIALANRIADSVSGALTDRLPSIHRRGGESDERGQVDVVDCFERRSPFDLVCGDGTKAVGLALHRRGDRVLVQGSIRRAPLGLEPDDDEAILRLIAAALGIDALAESQVTSAELARAEELVKSRYGRDEWNRRR